MANMPNTLLFMTLGADYTNHTVFALPMDGTDKPERLMSGLVDEAHVSPDGRWLAYISTESGRWEVYVEPFRRRGERLLVSNNGGGQPRWRSDGKEFFYLSLEGALMSLSVRESGTGLDLGIPTMLIPADRLKLAMQGPDYDDWDVAPDGQRFLMKVSAAPIEKRRIYVLLNSPSLLER